MNAAGGGGGAIATTTCPMNISNSTFVNNSAAIVGGALSIFKGEATLTNNTFYSNTAPSGGSIDVNDASVVMTITNNTIAGNVANEGSAIRNIAGTITLRNTIVANNTGSAGCSGTITNGNGNLRWQPSDTSCPGTDGDPKLAALANNGGPTQTVALQAGSAAIQLASANCPTTDQRGFVRRLLGGKCDAGAYEYGAGFFFYLPAVFK